MNIALNIPLQTYPVFVLYIVIQNSAWNHWWI